MFDFPDSPYPGQTISSPNGVFMWDGSKWAPPGEPAVGFSDAPQDGFTYGRINATWGRVTTDSAPAPANTLRGNNTAALAPVADLTASQAMTLLGAAPLSSPALIGVPTAPTAPANTNTGQIATTAYVAGQLTKYAPLASPGFTGTPIAPTAPADTNTIQIATTAYVVGQASSTSPAMDGTAAVGASVKFARADHVHPTDTTLAPLASPALTGTPTAPTPATTDNSTTVATTAFVKAATSSSASVQGAFKNLVIAVPSDTTVNVAADALVLYDGTAYSVNTGINVTASTGTGGVNGIDTGALAASTWYSVWVIRNTSTGAAAALLSTSATAPVMPTGYAAKARVGWVRAASSGTALLKTLQKGRTAQYILTGTAPNTAVPIIVSGAQGTITSGSFIPVAVPWVNVAPPTASAITAMVSSAFSTNSAAALAPNANYGTPISMNAPPMLVSGAFVICASMLLETGNVYYAAQSAVDSATCLGWEDNL